MPWPSADPDDDNPPWLRRGANRMARGMKRRRKKHFVRRCIAWAHKAGTFERGRHDRWKDKLTLNEFLAEMKAKPNA